MSRSYRKHPCNKKLYSFGKSYKEDRVLGERQYRRKLNQGCFDELPPQRKDYRRVGYDLCWQNDVVKSYWIGLINDEPASKYSKLTNRETFFKYYYRK